jgi:hypothetical protein
MAIPFQDANLTLAQMRQFVGELSDLDIGPIDEGNDITVDLVNGFVKEGFQKIVALSNRWPYYQTTYGFATVENIRSYSSFNQNVPTPTGSAVKNITDIQQITAVINNGPSSGNNGQGNSLIYIDQARAESIWVGSQDQADIPAYFSIWADQLNLWPKPNVAYDMTIRGYRIPSLEWLSDINAAIDISPTLQLPLINYVMARIFQFNEDTEMAREYMNNFERGVAIIQGNLTAPSSNRQLIMSGGLQLTPYDWWWSDTPNMQVLPGSPYPLGVAF